MTETMFVFSSDRPTALFLVFPFFFLSLGGVPPFEKFSLS